RTGRGRAPVDRSGPPPPRTPSPPAGRPPLPARAARPCPVRASASRGCVPLISSEPPFQDCAAHASALAYTAHERRPAPIARGHEAAREGPSMRVLLVEDEPGLASALRQGLAEAEYTVDLARDGAEGLAFARAAAYDIVVLDVLLPRLDGLALCRRLRAAGLLTPILLLTARDTVADRVAGLDSGADDYLVKPFAF